jgi:hypothetical protein
VKTPIWGFAGLIAIAVVISFAVIWNIVDNNKLQEFIENPQAHDSVVIKYNDNKKIPYEHIEIESIEGDKILFRPGLYAYSHESAAKDEAFGPADKKEMDEDIYEMTFSEFRALNIKSFKRGSKS